MNDHALEQEIRRLKAEGVGQRKIAAALNVNRNFVRKVLAKPDPKMPYTPEEKRVEWVKLKAESRKRRDQQVGDPVEMRCVQCNRPMLTWDPKLEDVCEECAYILRMQNAEREVGNIRSAAGVMVNPFKEM